MVSQTLLVQPILPLARFESIFVVSPNKSLGGETVWRQEGMIRAANLTGLNIQIPPQPNFPLALNSIPWLTPSLIAKIKNDTGEDGKLHDGRLMSRLGHLSVLHHILDSKLSSAIVMENDCDWGVEIKSQTPSIAPAVRNLTRALTDTKTHPWGSKFDFIALGHCGATRRSDFLVVNDTTALPPSLYSKLRHPGHEVPEQGRMIYETSGPVCTYAYGVTRMGAAKLIMNLQNAEGPWDLLVVNQCDKNPNFWCAAVTPEIFHHQRWTGHAVLSGPAHGALQEGERSEKFTHNIWHSARCNSEPDVDLRNGLVECLPMNWTRTHYPT